MTDSPRAPVLHVINGGAIRQANRAYAQSLVSVAESLIPIINDPRSSAEDRERAQALIRYAHQELLALIA